MRYLTSIDLKLLHVNSVPLSDLICLTVPYGAVSARNISAASVVSLFCLKKYTIFTPNNRPQMTMYYLKPSLAVGSIGPAKSQCTNSNGHVACLSGSLFHFT